MAFITYKDTNLPDVKEMRNTWCFGLPLAKDDGGPIDDPSIEIFIDGAISEVERRLGVFLKPTAIASNPKFRGLVEGVDYEVAEPAYDYSARDYSQWGFLQLRQRPIQEITGLKMALPNGQVVVDFMTVPDWIKTYPEQGQIEIVPYAGDPSLFYLLGGSQVGYPLVTGRLNSDLPQMFFVDYVAGFAKDSIPQNIRNIVAKMAACDILGIAGDAMLAGVASLSTSIDGLNESYSTTASATNATYGAHILQYQKDIDAFFDKGNGRSTTRGFTMTGL